MKPEANECKGDAYINYWSERNFVLIDTTKPASKDRINTFEAMLRTYFSQKLEEIEMMDNTEVARSLTIEKRWFYSFARYTLEYIYDIEARRELLSDLREKGADLFTFVQRNFVHGVVEKRYAFHREIENVAILKITSYNDWWRGTIRKKERQSVKKAEKSGVKVKLVEVSEDFIRSAQRIYNETPIREGRKYSGYGLSIEDLRKKFEDIGDSDILVACLNGEVIGLLWMTYGDRAAMFRSFISFIKHRDKCPNNALIAEAVKRCSERQVRFLVYGDKYGFLPDLDRFRKHQGFRKFLLPKYYIPLSRVGQLAIKLGIHRKIEYSLSPQIERALLPLYNCASRIVPSALWWQYIER